MKEHLKERGIWYPIGVAISLALILPGLHGELGWSLGFALAAITMVCVAFGACLVVFAGLMLVGRASENLRRTRR
jgi:hypothetical protein